MPLFGSNRQSVYEPIDDDAGSVHDQRVPPQYGAMSNTMGEDAAPNSYQAYLPNTQHASTAAISDSVASDMTNSKREHRWDHIKNADEFFALVYEYHQGGGYMCIALKSCLALFQFIFVVVFSTFLAQCVDYDILFANTNKTADGVLIVGKRHLNDAVVSNCASSLNPLVILALLIAIAFWSVHVVRVGMHLLQLYEIQTFFRSILEIPDWELDNVQWREVVEKICKKQPERHFLVNQEHISPLDIYQRILRYKNYMVAIIDNDVLPLQLRVPFYGQISYLSSGLRFNLDWLLFWGAWAPWKSCWELKPELKSGDELQLISDDLQKAVFWTGLVNLALFPFIFIYQILFGFFSYAELLRREPGVLGSRKYSNYGRLQLRHYNELDHELNTRLSKSYEHAARYMDQFVSTTTELAAKLIAFICGSIFAVLFVLSVWDEDVLTVEHVLTIMTVLATACLICRTFIQKENVVFCHDLLVRKIVSHIHYAPTDWIREARSNDVCAEFGRIFQLKAQNFAEELLSPLITPYILLYHVRPNVESIVTFMYENTRHIDAVGDVCKYSLMDLVHDGDPRVSLVIDVTGGGNSYNRLVSKQQPAKVELSLLNFVAQNPSWRPPAAVDEFVRNIGDMWAKDLQDVIKHEGLPAAAALGTLLEEPHQSTSASASVYKRHSSMQAAYDNQQSTIEQTSEFKPLGDLGDATDVRETSFQRSSGRGGIFTDSAAAALSASSMYMSSVQQSGLLLGYGSRHAGNQLPAKIQENNQRALQMSMNALAITDLLMSRGNGAFAEIAARNQRSSYNQPSSSGDARMESVHRTQFGRGVYGGDARHISPSVSFAQHPAASNIWGVPSESHIDGDQDDDDLEHVHADDSHDQPPSAFNV